MTEQEPEAPFQPHVPDGESPPELTFRAVALGAVLGIVYGMASTYLALRVGLTVSASVPIAVLAIAILRKTATRRTILEHNVVQTAGSAGESVAGALAFTIPALIFLGYPLRPGLTTLVALTGGCLGVLMMVPLRRYLIVKEHGKLRYPEGKACAEILIAGEKGGTTARKVFVGMAWGAAFKALQAVLGAIKISFTWPLAKIGEMVGPKLGGAYFKNTAFACDFEPALLGVGYILGYKTSVLMVAGSILATFVIIPIFVLVGQALGKPLAPETTKLLAEMSPGDIWSRYVKPIGAGSVAMGGLFALVKALPAILSALRGSFAGLFGGGGKASAGGGARTDRDAPMPLLVFGALAIVAFIWLVPVFQMTLLGAVLILVFGFLFAVVSSRITGEVGSSSCPLSGMTIAVLMGICGIFVMTGRGGDEYVRLALILGAIVCIAISNAGTCSQDQKTGFLIGATPSRQQAALLCGVLACVPAVGWTTYLLNESEAREIRLTTPFTVAAETVRPLTESFHSRTDGKEYLFVKLDDGHAPKGEGLGAGNYLVDATTRTAVYRREDGIGGSKFGAPQSKLMSVIIGGVMEGSLPWDLILIGAAIAIFAELIGYPSLTFAVGVYLPLSSTMPIFLGGFVRRISDRRRKRVEDAEEEPEGTLWCSGLIAGASILAVLATMQGFFDGYDGDNGYHPAVALLRGIPGWMDGLVANGGDWFGLVVLLVLGWLVYDGAAARKSEVG